MPERVWLHKEGSMMLLLSAGFMIDPPLTELALVFFLLNGRLLCWHGSAVRCFRQFPVGFFFIDWGGAGLLASLLRGCRPPGDVIRFSC
jgi:hypothetical protein